MSSENPNHNNESFLNPEKIKEELSQLYTESDNLKKLIAESGENIDVELGSEDYIDLGYTVRLREEIEPKIKKLELQLQDIEDREATQRNLNI